MPLSQRLVQRVALRDFHARGAAGLLGEADLRIGAEQDGVVGVDRMHIDHEAAVRHHFDELAVGPVIGSLHFIVVLYFCVVFQ